MIEHLDRSMGEMLIHSYACIHPPPCARTHHRRLEPPRRRRLRWARVRTRGCCNNSSAQVSWPPQAASRSGVELFCFVLSVGSVDGMGWVGVHNLGTHTATATHPSYPRTAVACAGSSSSSACTRPASPRHAAANTSAMAHVVLASHRSMRAGGVDREEGLALCRRGSRAPQPFAD